MNNKKELKELILNTDYLLKNDYLNQFHSESKEEKNIFKKWLSYKTNNLEYKNKNYNTDLDTSLEAIIVYWMQLSIYKNDNIKLFDSLQKQKELGNQYEFNIDNNLCIHGDWLTSPMHIIKVYMSKLWQKIDKSVKDTNDFYKLFNGIAQNTGMLKADKPWLDLCCENADLMWKSFDKEIKEFIQNSIMTGNFIAMPVYINPSRCEYQKEDDTVDCLLWKIYSYCHMNNDEKDKYLMKALTGGYAYEARKNFKQWLKYFNDDWNTFVEKNYFSAFIEKTKDGFGRPISLKTGNPIECELGDEYAPMPKDLDECLKMLDNYNKFVEDRTNQIYQAIKDNKELFIK